MKKKTLVVGASLKTHRYSNKAIRRLIDKGHEVKALGLRKGEVEGVSIDTCLLYTSPSPRDRQKSRMPSSA